MTDRRSAVFLEEMGVGPQWRLRNRAASAADTADASGAVDAAGAAYAADSMPAPPAAVTGTVPRTTPEASQPTRPSAAPAPDAHATMPLAHTGVPAAPTAMPPSPAAAAARAAVPRQEPGAMPASPAAVAGEAPSPASPAAPARVPGTPSIASTGEDMSWFDDAPTPEFKPQRKKVAPEPEQPSAAHPQRPAAAAPPARPAPAAYAASGTPGARPPLPSSAASGAPGAPGARPLLPPGAAMDDVPALPMDEPPAWFDDEQPAAQAAPAGARHAEPPAGQGQATDEEIAAMDWPALQAAVAACTRCGRCATRQQAIPGRGDQQATWLALDTAPGQQEDAEGYQFAGDPGYLLDNMLKAVGQTTEKGAYLTSLVKCHAPHAPSADELQACRPYLERELQLTRAKVIVAFGHGTGKGLLGGAARGRIMLHGEVPVVATYHPADLLKKPEEKAKAWQDLCLAKAAHAGRR